MKKEIREEIIELIRNELNKPLEVEIKYKQKNIKQDIV